MLKERLQDFIEDKKEYLDRLYDLGDDWLHTNKSFGPNECSIEETRKFLDAIKEHAKGIENIKNIGIGPTPIGGVVVHIIKHGDETICDNDIYIFHNNGKFTKEINTCDQNWSERGEIDFREENRNS